MHFKLAVLGLGLMLTACSSGGGGDQAPVDTDMPSSPGAGTPSPDEPAEPASALFVLGDSLSDVGNAAGAVDYVFNLQVRPSSVGLCNPADVLVLLRPCDDLFHRQNRVTDGPVAVEHLAAHVGVAELVPSLHLVPSRPVSGTGYAVASAKARGRGTEDLERQVDVLLLEHAPLPADALYVVMIGGNDAIDAFQAEVASAEAAVETSTEIVAAAVAAIGANLERLLDFGARRLVIANVPDLAALPAVRLEAGASGDESAVLAAASAISDAFDRELDALLDEIESRGQWLAPTPPVLVRFDLRAALEAARQASAAGGGNMHDACFDSEIYWQSAIAERIFHPDCAPTGSSAPHFDEFVFWDGIHPTGNAHAAIGAALIDAL
jgi:phospholipase/lecithinase/hemolysin